jgi:predicted phosphodiesterase
MLVAILSDIHANYEALCAVVSDFVQINPEKVICLGDLIGYGPDPDEVVQYFRTKGYLSVLGNHEAVLADRRLLRWFNFQAKENSLTTEKMLSEENLMFCQSLPASLQIGDAIFVHGFPPDSSFIYLSRMSESAISSFLQKTDGDLFFVGHTHDLLIFCWDGSQLTKHRFTGEPFALQNGCKYIVNAGSVGQPRDGDNRAKYLIWDTENRYIEVRRVLYDYKKTAKKIVDLGFPMDYAIRLG